MLRTTRNWLQWNLEMNVHLRGIFCGSLYLKVFGWSFSAERKGGVSLNLHHLFCNWSWSPSVEMKPPRFFVRHTPMRQKATLMNFID